MVEQDLATQLHSSPDIFNYRVILTKLEKRFEEKGEDLSYYMEQGEYDFEEFKQKYIKLRKIAYAIEELRLKEKLCFKRALSLCLILLKQCRADVTDQSIIQICSTLIAPAVKNKDRDNFLIAIECIGLLCLLDKKLFSNYSRIFSSILREDVLADNKREKVVALKSVVDSFIIHGIEEKTEDLWHIITNEYLTIADKVLRQITIEGICKMLFSRKLT